MSRNFCYDVTLLQGFHHHLLLNGGDVLFKVKRANDVSANGAETVLAFCELRFPC